MLTQTVMHFAFCKKNYSFHLFFYWLFEAGSIKYQKTPLTRYLASISLDFKARLIDCNGRVKILSQDSSFPVANIFREC